jgi:hypothetical protein
MRHGGPEPSANSPPNRRRPAKQTRGSNSRELTLAFELLTVSLCGESPSLLLGPIFSPTRTRAPFETLHYFRRMASVGKTRALHTAG